MPPGASRRILFVLSGIGLTIVFVGLSALWVHLNRGPTAWDDSWYLTDSLKMFDALKADGPIAWGREFFNAQMRVKPPLICALPTPIYFVAGRVPRAAMGVQLLYQAILLLSLLGISAAAFGRRAALLTVFITATMPEIYGLATEYDVELGLAALTALAILLMLRSRELSRPWIGVILGAICGLGLLQKILFPLYVAPLLIYFIWRSRRRIVAAMTIGIPTLLIAGPWYIYNFKPAIDRAVFSGFSTQEAGLYSTGNVFTWLALQRYGKKIINEGIGPTYLIVGIFALLIVIALRFTRRVPIDGAPPVLKRWTIFGLWFLPLIVFAFSVNKDVRFIAPLLPVIAISVAAGMDKILSVTSGKSWLAIAPLLVAAMFCQVQMQFQPLGPRTWNFPRTVTGISTARGLRFVNPHIGSVRPIATEPWPLDETLDLAAKRAQARPDHPINILLASDSQDFNSNNLQLTAEVNHLNLIIRTTAYAATPAAADELLGESQILLYRTGGEEDNRGFNAQRQHVIDQAESPGWHEVPQNIVFPDGGQLHVLMVHSQ